ncbi:MAG TPA: FAD-binding oxidoreductase [Kiloniellaceae bacterium]|nr:FAD-binding oxidoreductase [Kiloniellaceae bacterium]
MGQGRRLERSDLASLEAGFSGALLLPTDADYDDVRRVHNGMIDRCPALIARCQDTADVVDALAFARDRGLTVAVRGGGHNVAGRAVVDDAAMIDLSPMKGAHVDPKGRRIRAQGGVTWGEFNRATQLHGLAATGGAVSSTGIAGLTLGGGFGFLMSKFGYTVDNLTAVELVTADGAVLQASADENSELFWGLRGGGGNFGIATSFEYRLHPVGPTVQGGLIAYPFEDTREMMRFYRDLSADAVDEFTLAASLTHSADGTGTRLGAMLACHCGSAGEGAGVMDRMRRFGTPAIDGLGPIPYCALNRILDPSFPKLALSYWKSCFLGALGDDVIDLLREAFQRCPSPMSKLILEHFHGAALRPRSDDTAFPHRNPGFSVLIISQWQDPSESAANIAWARETYDALQPFTCDGAYSNYLDDDEKLAGVRRAFGENFARLQALKDRYDPENLFRHNQNIPPSGEA